MQYEALVWLFVSLQLIQTYYISLAVRAFRHEKTYVYTMTITEYVFIVDVMFALNGRDSVFLATLRTPICLRV